MALRFALAAVLAVVALVLACPEPGPPPPSGCQDDDDCGGGRVCSVGECIECLGNEHCGADRFCCQGTCYDASQLGSYCGCAAAVGTQGAGSDVDGDACNGVDEYCLASGTPVTVDTVAQGTCGCPCDPPQGGTQCSLGGEGQLVCSCSTADDEGTCGRPSLDDDGRPHVVADTCTPQGSCVCFANAEDTYCDPNGAAPDCSSAGCVDTLGDENNCGVGGRVCTDEAMGIAGTGVCLDGGCSCNDSADCVGTDLNVDLCAAVGSVLQCVCEDYEVGEQKAPCPLGLACATGGCVLDGTAYSTREALLAALGVPVTN